MLKLLAFYSPEFPCLIKGAAKYAPLLAKTFAGNQVKQFLEFGTAQYEPLQGRRPAGVRRDRPRAVVLRPAQPRRPDRPRVVQGRDRHRLQPADVPGPRPEQAGAAHRRARRRQASGYAGTEAEKAIVNALLAGETGRAADSYGALGSLLYGPVVRGEDAS